MFPVPATDPAGVNTPLLSMVPSSPRSIDQAGAIGVPPTAAVNCTVGTGCPVMMFTTGMLGVIASTPGIPPSERVPISEGAPSSATDPSAEAPPAPLFECPERAQPADATHTRNRALRSEMKLTYPFVRN